MIIIEPAGQTTTIIWPMRGRVAAIVQPKYSSQQAPVATRDRISFYTTLQPTEGFQFSPASCCRRLSDKATPLFSHPRHLIERQTLRPFYNNNTCYNNQKISISLARPSAFAFSSQTQQRKQRRGAGAMQMKEP